MRERPILFSGPMVRALLAGTKTQTRRLLRVEMLNNDIPGVRVPGGFVYLDFDGVPGLSWRPRGGGGTEPYPADRIAAACPFGVPGDRLWVRETFATPEQGIVAYRANGECGAWMGDGEGGRVWINHGWIHGATDGTQPGKWYGLGKYGGKWRPSIFMPRWASRITLEVTGVRVERLQEITEEDAQAEGIRGPLIDPELDRMVGGQIGVMPRAAFAKGWDTINGKRAAWDSNPWVWVVSFRRVQP